MPTVEDQQPFNEYTGNGVTTVYGYEFQLLAANDLVVKVAGVVVPASEFILLGVGNQSGGTVELNTPPGNGVNVLLYREMLLERDTDYQEQGDLLADTVNNDFNRLWLALQQQRTTIAGAIRAEFPISLNALPGDPADYEGYYLGLGPGGQPTYQLAPTGSAAALAGQLADASNVSQGDALIGVRQPLTGAVARTQHNKNQEWISVKDFGALGNDAAEDSAAIILADAAAVAAGVPLLFPPGTYRCKALTLHDIIVNGVIKATGSTAAEAVILAGAIDANEDRQIFAWTATDPTNLPGTTYPFLFQYNSAGNFGGRVSVKWFGAKGNNVADEARFINACATAMSKSQVGGTPYATMRGPVEMHFPRGNYRIGASSTVSITTGTVVTGQASGSNPLSTLIKDDVTYGAGSADMIWVVGDNVTHTDSAAQIVFQRMSFIWRPSIDFATSTLQLDTAFINFKALCIDAKFHDCWFLGAPQKGAIYAWGNKYTAAPGGGLQKTNTGADSDGLLVTIHTYGTFFDVCYGTLATVLDKGYGAIYINTAFVYQLWLGFSRNYSTHSTERLLMVFNTPKLYGICAAADATIYNLDNHAATITTGRTKYRNTDILINAPQITNAFMTGISFAWQCWLQNSTMHINGGVMESTDGAVRFFYPLFGLDQYANSLRIKGVSFRGAMTPGGGVPANFQSLISRINTGTLTGATDSLIVTGNDIDIGTMAYFVYKDGTNATITDTEVTGNVCSFVSGRVSFDVVGATRYHFTGNYYSNTANVLTP